MKTTNNTPEQKRIALLKKFHTLASITGMNDDAKHALVASYGKTSSRDLSIRELLDVTIKLTAESRGGSAAEPFAATKTKPDMNLLRKRVFAVIGAYLRKNDYEDNADVIKAIACRVTGNKDFNRIPRERLQNIYNLFCKKNNDAEQVNAICDFITRKRGVPRTSLELN